MIVGSVYLLSILLMFPCIIFGRMANLHNPAEGINTKLAWTALVCGVFANLLGLGVMLYIFVNALTYKG